MTLLPTQATRAAARAVCALLCLALAGCGTVVVTPTPVELTVVASSGALPLAALLADAYHQRNPHITVVVEPVGSEAAAQRYVELGRAELALVTASQPVTFSTGLTGTQVATDALVIAVHADNPMQNIGLEQARQLFSGRLRLWSEVDAGHGAIQVLTREPKVAERTTFEQAAMGRRQITPTALVLPGNRELLEALAADPLAIGYLPANWLDARVKALTLEGASHEWVALNVPGYRAPLPIYAVTAGPPADAAAALLEFALSPAGAELMAGRYGRPGEVAP